MATFHNICLLFCLLKVFKFRHKWTHSCRTVLCHSEKVQGNNVLGRYYVWPIEWDSFINSQELRLYLCAFPWGVKKSVWIAERLEWPVEGRQKIQSTSTIPEKQEENVVTEFSSQKEYSIPTNSDLDEETDQPIFNFVNLEENNIPFLLMTMTLRSWVPSL